MFRRAWNLSDYLELRRIRNSGCEFLTNFSGRIGVFKQLKFWLHRKDHEIYIFSYKGETVGYISISCANQCYLITIVMLPGFRGAGLGKIAVNYIKQFYSPMVAEIFANNIRSIKLFESCGFENVRALGGRVFLHFSC